MPGLGAFPGRPKPSARPWSAAPKARPPPPRRGPGCPSEPDLNRRARAPPIRRKPLLRPGFPTIPAPDHDTIPGPRRADPGGLPRALRVPFWSSNPRTPGEIIPFGLEIHRASRTTNPITSPSKEASSSPDHLGAQTDGTRIGRLGIARETEIQSQFRTESNPTRWPLSTTYRAFFDPESDARGRSARGSGSMGRPRLLRPRVRTALRSRAPTPSS